VRVPLLAVLAFAIVVLGLWLHALWQRRSERPGGWLTLSLGG
jgi:hypothetical protein